MQPAYLLLLTPAVRDFVLAVENEAGLAVEVVPDAELNGGGPLGNGKLRVDIGPHHIRLGAPTNGYFPSGAVRHELLHVRRLHVEGVPQLVLADEEPWDQSLVDSLTAVDNALEHLLIVPCELRDHPERREHWEAVMTSVWTTKLPAASILDCRIGACLHWAFLRHVLPESPCVQTAVDFMRERGLWAEAEEFYARLLPALGNMKEDVVRFFFHWFENLPRTRVALEYVSSETGSRQEPVPGP